MSMLCQVPGCSDAATHRAWEPDDTSVRLCTPHADYARALNEDVPEQRRVSVEPLEGSA